MDLTLLHLEECPNWKIENYRPQRVALEHPKILVEHQLVKTLVQAGWQIGLTCREPSTTVCYEGEPTLNQLSRVFTDA